MNSMDRRKWLYLAAVSAIAVAAQLTSLTLGFEADTGLPRAGVALWLPALVLAAGVVGALHLTRHLDRCTDVPVETLFPFESTAAVASGVVGSFLLLGSAALGFIQGESRTPMQFAVLMGLGTLYLTVALRHDRVEPMMTLPMAYLMPVLLLLRYRECSYVSAWVCFYLEVLALAALVGCYMLFSGFAFRRGRPRLYAAVALISVPLCMCAALQADSLAHALRFLGHAAVQIGCLAGFRPERTA